jgi:hypothetical protein
LEQQRMIRLVKDNSLVGALCHRHQRRTQHQQCGRR